MDCVSGNFDAGHNQSFGVNHGATALGPGAADDKNAIETVVLNLVIGNIPRSDREFAVAVVQHNSRAFIVMNRVRVDSAVFGIFDVDAVACAVHHTNVSNREVSRCWTLQMHGNGPDSSPFTIGDCIGSACGYVL